VLGGTSSISGMVYMRGPVAPAWRGSLKISCTYQAGAAFINIEVISSDGAAVGDRGRTHRFQKDSIPECNNVILRANGDTKSGRPEHQRTHLQPSVGVIAMCWTAKCWRISIAAQRF
jgi:hypothetical protein